VTNEDTIIQFSEAMNTDSVFAELVKIQSWPTVGLVFAVVIIIGYCLRFWKFFPNEAIPTVVIFAGAAAMLLVSDGRPESIGWRVWNVKLGFTGLIIGFIAWMAHNLVISKLEDFLSTKFASVNRALGPKDPPPPPVDPPAPHPLDRDKTP
jgi:hypothetical protein